MSVDDFQKLGRSDGEQLAREFVSARQNMTRAEEDIWLRTLWFSRIPETCARLHAAGAGETHLEAYVVALRRAYRRHMQAVITELENSRTTIH